MPVIKSKRNAPVIVPDEIPKDVIEIMNRIEKNAYVTGILYAKKDNIVTCTVPRGAEVILNKRLPSLNLAIANAVKEINVLDELIAYRVVSKSEEISVAMGSDFVAGVVHTAKINQFNPMVDRIMDDDSVEGVIMTNKEGAPILTNVSLTHACLYGLVLHKYSLMSKIHIKELVQPFMSLSIAFQSQDPFEEIIAVRIKTKKNELILAPDAEFLIIVIQHSRKIVKHTKDLANK